MHGMFNELIARTLPIVPKSIVHLVAKKYVAGETLDDAVGAVRELNKRGILATMDVLGEFVSEREQAQAAISTASQMLDAIRREDLGSGVSVKLTSMGLDIDAEECYANVRELVNKAKSQGRFLRLDMENSPYTDRTLQIYRRLRADGLENTGVVIQAYLKRSADDIRALSALKAPVRLCKGIYVEPETIAIKGRKEVQENYKQLLELLFEKGMHAAIATHDDVLLDHAREYIARNKIDRSRYEFQMLLGVREQKRDELVREGHRVRIYVPFGKDWYGYSLRRLKENPEIGGHIMRAILTGD